MSQNQNTTELENKVKAQKPKLYKVVLHNDDYTPMDFVVTVLVHIFKKNPTDAYRITMEVHHQKKGIAGVYSRDIAETKITEAHAAARRNKFPLKCTMEPE